MMQNHIILPEQLVPRSKEVVAVEGDTDRSDVKMVNPVQTGDTVPLSGRYHRALEGVAPGKSN